MQVNNKVKFLSVLILGLILTGCSTRPLGLEQEEARIKDVPSPTKGKAGVYIFTNSLYGFNVWINDKCFGETISNSFFYAEVVGNKEYQIGTEISKISDTYLSVFMEEGKNYFIERSSVSIFRVLGFLALPLNIYTVMQPILKVVDEIEGKKEIQLLSLVVDKEGKASTKNSTLVVNGICK